jgi:hypothetical protein
MKWWNPLIDWPRFCPIRSIFINQDLHPKIVQQHLGQSSIVVTMDRYRHRYPSDNERAHDALDAAFEAGLVQSSDSRIEPDADQNLRSRSDD